MKFSRTTTALSLWEFGEDDLSEVALTVTDSQLRHIQNLASQYDAPSFVLPVLGQRVSHGQCVALAAVTHLEGVLRPLARNRRRPKRDTPERLLAADHDYGDPRG